MAKTSILIPLYNEGKFIEKTLMSVVGQADQIIISDNASTDGTSEICQKFALEHPEIEYTRHEENKGVLNNFDYCLNQSKGEYIMFIGAHDLISRDYVKNLAVLLDENPDAIGAFANKTIFLNEFYSFNSLHLAEDIYGDDLISDSPFFRVNSIVNKIKSVLMWNGLYRSEVFKNVTREYNIFDKLNHDVVFITNIARKGKFIIDKESTFYRIRNRTPDHGEKRFRRIIKACRPLIKDEDINPVEWTFAKICGTYKIALEMQKLAGAPPDFAKKILQDLFKRDENVFWDRTHFENFSIIPGQEAIVEEIKAEIIKEKNKRKKLFLEKIIKRIEELSELYSGRKIVIYGAGKLFEDINAACDLSRLNIAAISDIKFTEEAEYHGFKAIPPTKINKEKPDVVFVALLNTEKIRDYFEKEYFPAYGRFNYEFLIS